ncbi:hypothetical protein D9M69_549440 [compost metagenome]
MLHHACKRLLHGNLVADIRGDRQCVPARLADGNRQRLDRRLRTGKKDNGCAGLRKGAGSGRADTLAGACDQSNLSCESKIVCVHQPDSI